MPEKRDEIRDLNSIPVGSLGLIPLESCRELGEKVNNYLVKWRKERSKPRPKDHPARRPRRRLFRQRNFTNKVIPAGEDRPH